MDSKEIENETSTPEEQDYTYEITIPEEKYNELILIESYYDIWKKSDFILNIKQGELIPSNDANYYKNRIYLEIIDLEDYSIEIEGKEYILDNQKIIKIKNYINTQISQLIKYASIPQNKIDINAKQKIMLKIGNVTIRLDGNTTREVKDFCTNFITEIIMIIKKEEIEFLG